jgi:DNA-directed RNA polymerase sigma subunit (sigma70/sigma32)
MWIDYEQEKNCCLISIKEKQIKSAGKSLTLHETGERLGINYLKVRQIEMAALRKLSNKIKVQDLFEEIKD